MSQGINGKEQYMHFAQLKTIAIKYKWFLALFPVFLAIQLYQSLFFRWDPFVFYLQGKWFCGEKIYFEFLRAPLPGAVNCSLGAGNYAPQLSIILASFLYLAALLLVFKKETEKGRGLNQLVFASLALLFPTILWTNFGSELFAISFLLIALSVQSEAKGALFGLSVLSRYNFILYAPVLLLQIKPKKWPAFFALFFLMLLPWLFFNYTQAGNPLFSVEDFLYLDVVQKGIAAPITPEQIGLILFFFASALAATGFDIKAIRNAFFQIGLIGCLQFIFSGIKENRYLAVLVPLQALFLAEKLNKNKKISAVLAVGLLALLLITSVSYAGTSVDLQKKYVIPNDQKLRECRLMSDQWVRFYAQGIVAEPLPGASDFDYFLKNGASLMIYDGTANLENSTDYEIVKTENYLFLKSNKCAPQPKNFVLKVWRGNWTATK